MTEKSWTLFWPWPIKPCTAIRSDAPNEIKPQPLFCPSKSTQTAPDATEILHHRARVISIVIPTYNRHETLARAIDSVCNQTFRDWELLIVDDGSTDESHKIVQQFRDGPHPLHFPAASRSEPGPQHWHRAGSFPLDHFSSTVMTTGALLNYSASWRDWRPLSTTR